MCIYHMGVCDNAGLSREVWELKLFLVGLGTRDHILSRKGILRTNMRFKAGVGESDCLAPPARQGRPHGILWSYLSFPACSHLNIVAIHIQAATLSYFLLHEGLLNYHRMPEFSSLIMVRFT